jgi:hypothetical protein
MQNLLLSTRENLKTRLDLRHTMYVALAPALAPALHPFVIYTNSQQSVPNIVYHDIEKYMLAAHDSPDCSS